MKPGQEGQAACVECLSMHQPWASLLVYGIKRIEGRNWPTNHRGWLWIASTAQEPSAASIEVWNTSLHGGMLLICCPVPYTNTCCTSRLTTLAAWNNKQ